MSWFKHWFGSPYYGLLYGHHDEDEAQAWVSAILHRWELPRGGSILDMACGRGRHARWFAESGMKVTGIDIDAACIETARRAVPSARFRVHDMLDPYGDGEFDAATCLFTSLGYTDEPADDQRAFANATLALRPGGRFVVEFMNTAAVLHDLVPEGSCERGRVRFDISRSLEAGSIVKRITVRDGGEVHLFQERVRALLPADLEALALNAGLVVEDRTDGPGTTPFDPAISSRFVLWMRKPDV